MARGSGSYRDWEAERRRKERAAEQARQKRERERKAQERERLQAEAAARDAEAADRTRRLEARVEEIGTVLHSSLRRDPRVRIASLRRRPNIPPLDLGEWAKPEPSPSWEAFAPVPPGWLQRKLGGAQRYETALRQAESDFARAQTDHQQRETQRQMRVVEARQAHQRKISEAEREAAKHNSHLDAMEAGLRSGDRHAVSEYMDLVLRASPYPEGFPNERRAGYVPESSLLAIEWYLPPPEIVPEHKLYKHIKTRKAVEPTSRPILEARQIYQRVIAQISLRTLREVFEADPGDLISTVVFNGLVRAVDPATGQQIEPHLITLRATREQFSALVLDEPKFNPVECVRRHFHADISPHPDELVPVEPVMPFSMADPRIVDPIDIISDIDKRPNLLDLHPKEFEAFIERFPSSFPCL